MPFWFSYFVASLLCYAMDRVFGLGRLLTGFSILFFVIGCMAAAGLNISDMGPILEILILVIFMPISARLYFVFASRHPESRRMNNNVPADGIGDRQDRNAERAYKGLFVLGSAIRRFTFHFVTGGLLLASLATISGWVDRPANLILLSAIGYPFVAEAIADSWGIKGYKKILCAVAGIIFGVLFSGFIVSASAVLHGA